MCDAVSRIAKAIVFEMTVNVAANIVQTTVRVDTSFLSNNLVSLIRARDESVRSVKAM